LDYLPDNTLIAIDEPEQCLARDRWVEHAEEQWQQLGEWDKRKRGKFTSLPKIHRSFDDSLATAAGFKQLYYRRWKNNGLNR